MILKDILGAKGNTVHCIEADAALENAVRKLIEHNVGSLVIVARGPEGEQPVGIVTERDLLRYCASGACKLGPAKVSDLMSTKLVTASPDDRVDQIMGVMTQKRMRHLPVCEEGRLVGLVSIGDVVKAQHDRLAVENRFMRDYIQG